MARLARAEVFDPSEIAIVHVMNRVVRRCILFGDDPISGKNFDHRKVWIEDQLRLQAACFGIDLLGFAILPNHFHLILRSRPDCVEHWDDTEIARRWLTLCPIRKTADGQAAEPTDEELNTIRLDTVRLKVIRLRLSDLSWWMRILCQQIARRANEEDQQLGKFFQARFKAVRLLDEQALLACAAYVDLNPIRAALAETLASSDFTSVQRRIQTVQQPHTATPAGTSAPGVAESQTDATAGGQKLSPSSGARITPDQFLAPVALDHRNDAELGPVPNKTGTRCSDKGFLPMSLGDYLQLLDWTGRQLAQGKKGRIPDSIGPILQRLQLDQNGWCDLVAHFGQRFFVVAGAPTTIDATTSRIHQHRYHVPAATRQLFRDVESRKASTA